jgi:hypothetical protein
MQLSTDMTGKFRDAQDPLQRDLITLQRIINDMQNQLDAAVSNVTTLQKQLANGNLATSAAGAVTGLAGQVGLKTVSHDFTMTGLGTPASPLKVIPTSVAGAGVFYIATTTLSDATMRAIGTSVTTLVPGVANFVVQCLGLGISANQTTIGTNNVTMNSAVYTGTSTSFVGVPTTVIASPGSAGKRYNWLTPTALATQSTTQLDGLGLDIHFNQSAGSTYATGHGTKLTVAYCLIPSGLV